MGLARTIALSMCVLGLAAPGAAASPPTTFTVTTTADAPTTCAPGDECSLRQAVSLAGDAPGSTVVVPAGRYVLGAGGAIYVNPSTTITGASARTTIIDADGAHTADRAFRMLDSGATVTLSHLTVTGGTPGGAAAGGTAGGDILSHDDLTLDHVRLTGGAAPGGGGGVAEDGGRLTVDHSLLDGNTAITSGSRAEGGAILATGTATLAITDSTLTGDSAANGSAIAVRGPVGGATTLTSTTISQNTASGTGGQAAALSVTDAPAAAVAASVVAGNTPANCATGATADGGADVESGTDCGFAAAGDRPGADPLLGPLGDQGGETDVRPLGAGSPAIDLAPAAGCPATDQSDRSRPRGAACDSGAYEADPQQQPPVQQQQPPQQQQQPAQQQPVAPPEAAHTLVGEVSFLAPFAVSDQSLVVQRPPAARITVELRDRRSGQVYGPVSPRLLPRDYLAPEFEFDSLPACAVCDVLLRVNGEVYADRPVSFDGAPGQTSVGLEEFDRPGLLGRGTVELGSRDIPAGALRVRITRGSKVLADTATAPPHCGAVPTIGVCALSEQREYQYALSGLPDDGRAATVTLYQRAVVEHHGSPPRLGPEAAVDTATLELRSGPYGQQLLLPGLTALDAIPSHPHGHLLYGVVTRHGSYAPTGDNPKRLRGDPTMRVDVLSGRHRVATGKVTQPLDGDYRLTGLPACPRCTVELRDSKGVLDRASVDIPSTSPTVTRVDLQDGDATKATVRGNIGIPETLHYDKVRVRIQSRTGEILADSARLPSACVHVDPCYGQTTTRYRLQGVRLDTAGEVIASYRTPGGWIDVDSAPFTTGADVGETEAPPLRVLPGNGTDHPGRQLTGVIEPGGTFAVGADPAPVVPGTPFTLQLLGDDGGLMATTTVTAKGQDGYVNYVLTHLRPCQHCVLVLRNGVRVVAHSAVALPEADPSVTSAPNLLVDQHADGPYIGGFVKGSRRFRPSELEIRVLSASGHVLSSTSEPDVSIRCGAPARACPPQIGGSFRLGHMPTSGRVTVEITRPGSHRVLASSRVKVAGGDLDTHVEPLVFDGP